MFLEILQNSLDNTCARVSFLILGFKPATLLKKKLWHRCFAVNFAKFLRTSFLTPYRTPPMAASEPSLPEILLIQVNMVRTP